MARPFNDAIKHIVVVMLENRSFDNVLGLRTPANSRTCRRSSKVMEMYTPHQLPVLNGLGRWAP